MSGNTNSRGGSNNYRGNYREKFRGGSNIYRGNSRGKSSNYRGNSRGRSSNYQKPKEEPKSYDKDEEESNEENDDDNDDEEESNEEGDSQESVNSEEQNNDDDDEDEYHHSKPSASFQSINHAPARSLIDSSFRTKEVQPFIDGFIQSYNSNSNFLPEFYTDDAVFSLTFKKMPKDSEVAMLFTDNRNLIFYHKPPPVITGGSNILSFLRKKFIRGSNIVENKRNIQFVSNLFFAVDIYGTLNLYKNENESKTVNFAKSLVVIGRNGKLYISNDHLAICM